MKLTDLEPQFYKLDGHGYRHVDDLASAQGVTFLCPLGCDHHVGVLFRDRGVPDDEVPGPGRWVVVSGSGYADLTLSPSIHLSGPGCGWHGHVTSGEVTRC